MQEPSACELSPSAAPALKARLDDLEGKARSTLQKRGCADIEATRFLNLRFRGTDVAIMVAADRMEDYLASFQAQYKREFGFILEQRAIIVDDLRCAPCSSLSSMPRDFCRGCLICSWQTAVQKCKPESASFRALTGAEPRRVRATGAGARMPEPEEAPAPGALPPAEVHRACFDASGPVDTAVYQLDALSPGHSVPGPAVLINRITTIIVEPGCTAHITERGDVRIDVPPKAAATASAEECDPVQLAIFSHRFMSIAEQMGRALQRSSISVNIKERLDFSCALFGPDGALVANAPHMPVHLGSMSETVRAQLAYYTGACFRSNPCVVMLNWAQLAYYTGACFRSNPFAVRLNWAQLAYYTGAPLLDAGCCSGFQQQRARANTF